LSYRIIYTKALNSDLRKLQQSGKRGTVQKIRAAFAEAATNGEIRDLPRTRHGETRIPNVEKYDLGDGHRLIVQLVDGEARTRAFLFAGTHDESDRWLDAHRNYQWVLSRTDGSLEFVQVTEPSEARHVPADRLDLESPEVMLSEPLLRVLQDQDWDSLGVPPAAREYLGTVTASAWQDDPDAVMTRLDQLAGFEKASTLIDLLHHASEREWGEIQRRVQLATGTAELAPGPAVVAAMATPENSETFITFDDPAALPTLDGEALADWMLFLHPEQKKLAHRDFSKAARLRGISGSGKTCVLVHRARYLARKYGEPVLVVTLTESMRKLLEKLLSELCGAELARIQVKTMGSLVKHVIEQLHPRGLRQFMMVNEAQGRAALLAAVSAVEALAAEERGPLGAMSNGALREFLSDEIGYVKGRLLPAEYDSYLDARRFKRFGRGQALTEPARRACLEAIRAWDASLLQRRLEDQEGIVVRALDLVRSAPASAKWFRCVLADEVQDLSQLEVAVLGDLRTPEGARVADAENGLFLVGDGAQSIFRRGFTLRSAGIEVGNRSYVLRKNYRNSYEILTAAFPLVERYEFADMDEENIVRPTQPEFARRRGPRPSLVSCRTVRDEAAYAAGVVLDAVKAGARPGQICIVAATGAARDEAGNALTRVNVPWVELREDVDFDSDRVKISTIESAKGHEFAVVVIMALVEGVLPRASAPEEMSREAARLYVAMTRARDALHLTYNFDHSRPSRFLLDIQKNCQEFAYRAGALRSLGSGDAA
jgi:superfamily I DNA/RNA helicase